VTAKVVEYTAGWAGDGLVELAVGGGGHAPIVVKDGEGLEASVEIDVVTGDSLLGFNTGCNFGGIRGGHLDLRLVGPAAKHLLEGGGCRTSHKCQDEADDKGVEKDGAS
jgi:hypothetical protein